MRGVALPVEQRLLRGFHRAWGEAQFDERANPLGQQRVVQLIQFGPVVDQFAVYRFDGTEHVMKHIVEAEITEAQLVDRRHQMRLGIAADQRAGEIRADRQVVETIDRRASRGQIQLDRARRCVLRHGRGRCAAQRCCQQDI